MTIESHQDVKVTGMEAVKIALSESGRSMSSLCVGIGLSRGAYVAWGDEVPEKHLKAVSAFTGLHPKILRPDLAALFAEPQMEAEAS